MGRSSPLLTIRCGLNLTYEASSPTHIVLLIQPRVDQEQSIVSERVEISRDVPVTQYEDMHGNFVRRFELPVGQTTVRHDAFVSVSSLPESQDTAGTPAAPRELSEELMRYILPSRYCDSDRLMDFAFEKFGQIPNGLQRVQAICDWVHENIEYRWGSGDPRISASEVISRGFGICRDFAHVAIALSRCFNLPSRYVTGHLPDVGFIDPGAPMDFHAYMQVHVGDRWHSYDARFNVPRTGRIDIACGLDAVDCAFSTLYGAASLAWFTVWNYQVDPDVVRLGDPIDLQKRLDGTRELRFSTANGGE